MVKYTKEQLLHYLEKFSKEIGRTPSINDINKNKKYPSSSTYMNRFGTWNRSLKAAGLKVNLKKKYDKKEMLDSLVQLSNELGTVPKTKDLVGKRWIASSSTYRKMFGTWNNALKKAGILRKDVINLKEYNKRK